MENNMVELKEVQLDNRITHLAITGRLDIAGTQAIDMKFHGYTAARRLPTLVDISGLEFIASLGLAMFVSCGRTLQRFGTKMVLLNPTPEIEEILKAVGIDQGIPIVHSLDDGMRILFPVS
jgi:anti-anti-sigma factor